MGETTARVRATPGRAHLVVRPSGAFLRSTALSILFSAVPLAVALVWVSFPLGFVAPVGTVAVVAAVLTSLLVVRFRTVYAGVGSHHVEMRGLLGPRVVLDRAHVHRVVLATTFGPSVDRTTRQLVALTESGHPLFRMRGVLWDDTALGHLAEALDARVTELTKPMPLREFHRLYPQSRAWYERPMAILGIAVGVGSLVVLALVAETAGRIAH
ncbi:hypothetical protein DEI93_10930 [Curtobacterium sp. MCBD17_035]|uniref:hypothetical protein n=1 Tax=Curtobacterium sp. MCBD17_035 TaxID=2175673 RepID=UPI000DA9417B|nr:hypothetical protein [Curtobacterium sp. MCBD17_035]WIB66489.1 hypothetical protein DEI93_10930 [Curtobacterium sp. MCBD17_035]